MSNKSKRIIVGCVAIIVVISSLFTANIIVNANSDIVTTTTTEVVKITQPTSSTTEVASSSTTKGTVETTEETTKVVTTTKKATNTTTTEKETKTNKKTTYNETVDKNNSYEIRCKITHYCSCAICNGSSSGLTAMGTKLKPYHTIAVDKSVIPLGSTVIINGQEYRAEDTGVSGNTIDVCVSSHSEAYDKGVYYTTVTVYP